MKKIWIAILIVALMVTTLGCQGNNTETSETTTISGVEATEATTSSTSTADVTITLPAEYFSEEENFDPEAFNKEQGFVKTVVNEDGTVSITMTKAQHEDLLLDLKTNIDAAFDEMIESEETPYVKSIEDTEGNYEYFVVKVDPAGYEEAFFDITPLMISIAAMTYQVYDNMEPHCAITIVNVDTGDVITSYEYPEPVEE